MDGEPLDDLEFGEPSGPAEVGFSDDTCDGTAAEEDEVKLRTLRKSFRNEVRVQIESAFASVVGGWSLEKILKSEFSSQNTYSESEVKFLIQLTEMLGYSIVY